MTEDKKVTAKDVQEGLKKGTPVEEASVTLNLKDLGILNLMDYANLIDDMRKKKISWEQPKPGFIRVDKKDVDSIKN